MGKVRKSVKPNMSLSQASAEVTKPTFECEICHVSFIKKPLFTKHMMEHSGQKPFECDQCDRSFRSKDGLLRHMITHASGKKGGTRKSMPGRFNASSISDGSLKGSRKLNMTVMVGPDSPPSKEVQLSGEVAANSVKVLSSQASTLDLIQKSISPALASVRKSVGEMCSSLVKTVKEQTMILEESFEEDSAAKKMPAKRMSRKSSCNFECDVCHRSFDRAVSFTEHMKIHSEKNQFMCNICNEVFALKSQFNKHMAEHNKDVSLNGSGSESEVEMGELYECNVCNQTFRDEDTLKTHMLCHSTKKSPSVASSTVKKYFECNVCHCGFNEEMHLVGHMKEHSSKFRYACDVCHAVFAKKMLLNKHSSEHRMELSEDETSIEKSDSSVVNMSDETMKDGKLFECNICSCGFMEKAHLLQHMEEHKSKFPYVCDTCCFAFQRKLQLNKHMSEHKLSADAGSSDDSFQKVQVVLNRCSATSPAKTPFRCSICRSSFAYKVHLLKHMMEHSGEEDKTSGALDKSACKHQVQVDANQQMQGSPKKTSSECNICGYRFPQQEELAEHVKTHFDLFPFCCKICHFCFPKKAQLNKHVAVHEADSSLKDKDFDVSPKNEKLNAEPEKLQKNILKSSKKTFGCLYCSQNFEEGDELLNHVAECHECSVCGRSFQNKLELEEHSLEHSTPARFECGICHTAFCQKLDLIVHTMEHMNEVTSEGNIDHHQREIDSYYDECRAGLLTGSGKPATAPAKSFRCHFCEMCFRDAHLFSKHMEMHTGVQVSPENGQSAGRSAGIEMGKNSEADRMDIDERENPASAVPLVVRSKSAFECHICRKTFKTKIALNCHAISHVGKKPLKREPNTKSAIISSMARGHREESQQPSGDGLFECNICHMTFQNKGLRTKHIISSHSNKKPFECDVCNQEFWSRDGLNRHVKTHNGQRQIR